MTAYTFRVYYEDTDAGGIVYYANYLCFAERARTEYLRDLGVNHPILNQRYGVQFVVSECQAKFIKSARLDDLLEVRTWVEDQKPASLFFRQIIDCDKVRLATINVRVACVDLKGKPKKIPLELREAIKLIKIPDVL